MVRKSTPDPLVFHGHLTSVVHLKGERVRVRSGTHTHTVSMACEVQHQMGQPPAPLSLCCPPKHNYKKFAPQQKMMDTKLFQGQLDQEGSNTNSTSGKGTVVAIRHGYIENTQQVTNMELNI